MWVMFGGVASHKFVISFCMGMELVNSKAGKRTFIGSILFFGLITSVGIAIGGVITSGDTNALPVAVIEVCNQRGSRTDSIDEQCLTYRVWWLEPCFMLSASKS